MSGTNDCGGNCGGCSDCFKGVTIPVGPKGDQGTQGPAGTNGTNGTNGADGATGPTGPIGPTGATGATGPTGGTGGIGATGGIGLTGATGAAGATGAIGAAGSKILFGSGAPGGGLGADDDMYNDTTTSYPQMDVYQKVTGTWQSKGKFGNVVNPGIPTPDAQSFLFKANKISDQFLDRATVDMVLFFEDDITAPTYFDNGNVWSSFDFTSDQDTTNVEFTLEGLDLTNATGGPITVDVEIRHQIPPAAETVKAALAIVVPASSNILTALIKTPALNLLTGDKVRVVATPQTGVAGDIKATAGEFYDNTTV